MTGAEAVARARTLFLDERHPFGCAETTLLVLQEAFGLPEPDDVSAAMALNGGVAYGGGICGAITGAAIAVGRLADRRLADRDEAKRIAREIIAALMDEFAREHGAVDCRTLVGRAIRTPEQHQAFLDSGLWRDVCMGQIETVVRRLATLPDDVRCRVRRHRPPRGRQRR